ncbi:hypothetical protein VNI00_017563 [Paramarasmius palmivorus]|uniref:Uncharacterized protein n=1 Tax=Paramarasmius palmivorus TaxID=297713 RepID=A0AAW0B5Y7_9AGAR
MAQLERQPEQQKEDHIAGDVEDQVMNTRTSWYKDEDEKFDDDYQDLSEFQLLLLWTEDETFVLDELKDLTIPYLMGAQWTELLPTHPYLRCVEDFYHRYITPLAQYLVKEVRSWKEEQYDNFVRLERCSPFPELEDILNAGALHYCNVHCLPFVGEEPAHKILVKYLNSRR